MSAPISQHAIPDATERAQAARITVEDPTADRPEVLGATGLVKRYGRVTAVDGADFSLRAGEILADHRRQRRRQVQPGQVPVRGRLARRGRDPPRREGRQLRRADRGPQGRHRDRPPVARGVPVARHRLQPVPGPGAAQEGDPRHACSASWTTRACAATPPSSSTTSGVLTVQNMGQAVESLSGGQRQAVAVARAAAFGSRVVIMDEPTAALGVKESNRVLAAHRGRPRPGHARGAHQPQHAARVRDRRPDPRPPAREAGLRGHPAEPLHAGHRRDHDRRPAAPGARRRSSAVVRPRPCRVRPQVAAVHGWAGAGSVGVVRPGSTRTQDDGGTGGQTPADVDGRTRCRHAALRFRPVVLGGDIGAYSLARHFHENHGVRAASSRTTSTGLMGRSQILRHVIEPRMERARRRSSTVLHRLAARRRHARSRGAGQRRPARGRCSSTSATGWAPTSPSPTCRRPLLRRLTDKASFSRLCEELDVPHPRTVVVDLAPADDPDTSALDVPRVRQGGEHGGLPAVSFPGKSKGFVVRTSRATCSTCSAGCGAPGYRARFLVQDLVPGDDSGMRILTSYADRSSRVRYSSFGHVLLEEHAPTAIGNPAAILTAHDETSVEHARRLLEHVGWTGWANFDLKLDPRTGRTVFFELNPRLGRSNFYVAAGQLDPVGPVRARAPPGPRPLPARVARTQAVPDHLFTVLPRGLLLRYLPDRALRERVRARLPRGSRPQPALVRGRARPRAARRTSPRATPTSPQVRPVLPRRQRPRPGPCRSRRPCRDRPRDREPGPLPVGVVGGVGPLATAYFLERVVHLTDAATDQEHVDLVVHQRASIPDRTAFLLGRSTDDPGPVMAACARDLVPIGARGRRAARATPPSRSSPRSRPPPASRSSASSGPPCAAARDASRRCVRVGRARHRRHARGPDLPRRAGEAGLEAVVPSAEDQALVMAVIYDQVKAGRPADLAGLAAVADRLVAAGADCVAARPAPSCPSWTPACCPGAARGRRLRGLPRPGHGRCAPGARLA